MLELGSDIVFFNKSKKIDDNFVEFQEYFHEHSNLNSKFIFKPQNRKKLLLSSNIKLNLI